MTLQYEHNIRSWSKNIQFMSTCLETQSKAHFVFIKLVQVSCIFAYNVRRVKPDLVTTSLKQ